MVSFVISEKSWFIPLKSYTRKRSDRGNPARPASRATHASHRTSPRVDRTAANFGVLLVENRAY
jgi:hypothetical protein